MEQSEQANPFTEWSAFRNEALRLWEQGIRSGDSTIITLMYGYNEQETITICAILRRLEDIAREKLDHAEPKEEQGNADIRK